MGYDLRFDGRFEIAPPLSPDHNRYLTTFSRSWRRPRDPSKLVTVAEPGHEAVGLPLGPEAAFYVDGTPHTENDEADVSVLSFARPPEGQPGQRCCWRPTPDGSGLEWDGCEKFGAYADWLRYLAETFLAPWGHSLNGRVRWTGEEGAQGTLCARDGVVVDEADEPETPLDEEVNSWIACMRNENVEMRIVAAREIGCAIHADAVSRRAAVAALLGALEPPELAKAALETLGEFGEEGAVGSTQVGRLLEHADPHVRYWATYALGRMGSRARSQLPALERLKTDPEPGPRYGAIDAIKRLTASG